MALDQIDNPYTPLAAVDIATQQRGEDARYVCRIGKTTLIFDPSINIEVLLDTSIFRMPNTPEWLLGLCNRRGELVPVFDLRNLLGITKNGNEKNYLFIVDKDEYAVGFYIDDYPSAVYSVKPMNKVPVVHQQLKKHLLNAYLHEQETLLEIDHRSLFAAITSQLSVAV